MSDDHDNANPIRPILTADQYGDQLLGNHNQQQQDADEQPNEFEQRWNQIHQQYNIDVHNFYKQQQQQPMLSDDENEEMMMWNSLPDKNMWNLILSYVGVEVCMFSDKSPQWQQNINPSSHIDITTRIPILLRDLTCVVLSTWPSTQRKTHEQLLTCFRHLHSLEIKLPASRTFVNEYITILKSACINLVEFSISNAPYFDDCGISNVIQYFHQLHTLRIHDCPFTGLYHLSELQHLTHLEITSCNMIDEDTLQDIAACQHLTYLSLADCTGISNHMIQKLLQSENMKNLQILNLSGLSIQDEVAKTATSKHLQVLR